MPRGFRLFCIAAFVAILAAFGLAIMLQPQQPNFTGDRGYQEQSTSYRAGGSDCDPAKIRALSVRFRQGKVDACAEAEEQHRQGNNNLIEARRAVVAAEAAATASASQARIEAWGAGVGVLTLFAAIAAAIFAERAAFHTKVGANAAEKSLLAQDRVSAAELRPWVAVEIHLTKFSADADSISIHYELAFSNVGKTVADRFDFKSDTSWVASLHPDAFEGKISTWKEPTQSPRFAIIPGEKKKYFGSQTTMKQVIPWTGRSVKAASFVVIVSAFYRSPMDERWHRTDRGFTIGTKDGTAAAGFFIFDDIGGDDAEMLIVRAAYSGETS